MVDLPLDLQIYDTDSLKIGKEMRIERDDPYYVSVSQGWGDALRTALESLPPFKF